MKLELKLIFLPVFFFFHLLSYSQFTTIKGVVLNQDNSLLEFVNVIDSVSLKGTTTNTKGEFEIQVPLSVVTHLKISCIGYTDQTLILKSKEIKTGLKVVME